MARQIKENSETVDKVSTFLPFRSGMVYIRRVKGVNPATYTNCGKLFFHRCCSFPLENPCNSQNSLPTWPRLRTMLPGCSSVIPHQSLLSFTVQDGLRQRSHGQAQLPAISTNGWARTLLRPARRCLSQSLTPCLTIKKVSHKNPTGFFFCVL